MKKNPLDPKVLSVKRYEEGKNISTVRRCSRKMSFFEISDEI